MRDQCFVRHALAGAEQGIPELAGAVGKTGHIHSITPAEIGSLEISMARKELGVLLGGLHPPNNTPRSSSKARGVSTNPEDANGRIITL